MNYFVIGTDTDVGKTLISCALLRAFAGQGLRVVGMKPVAAGGSLHCNGDPADVPLAGTAGGSLHSLARGAPPDARPSGGLGAGNGDPADLNEDVRLLRAASNVPATPGQINPYSFAHAVSPHLAAQFVGVRINLERMIESCRELSALADVVIVEGAGGFRVPLNELQDGADLATELALPLILVVGMRLGCLNHALLTVESVENRGLRLAGWVANCVDGDMPMLTENIETLRRRIAAPLLGVVPHYPVRPDAGEVAARLDLQLLGDA